MIARVVTILFCLAALSVIVGSFLRSPAMLIGGTAVGLIAVAVLAYFGSTSSEEKKDVI